MPLFILFLPGFKIFLVITIFKQSVMVLLSIIFIVFILLRFYSTWICECVVFIELKEIW